MDPSFWNKVAVGNETECWPWQGALDYGMSYGRFGGTTAHRVAWSLANGRPPETEEVVRHRCDNPPCCNPAHLEIGTQADNVADAVERGRMWFQNRTECKRGHALTEENLYIQPGRKKTECLTCRRDREANRVYKDRGTFVCEVCGKVRAKASKARHLAWHDRSDAGDEFQDPED